MEELDKCIEKQKEEIRSISQDIVSSGAAASMATNLSNISLPSNLQQILDSIKNIPSTTSLENQVYDKNLSYSLLKGSLLFLFKYMKITVILFPKCSYFNLFWWS